MVRIWSVCAYAWLLFGQVNSEYTVDWTSTDSIKQLASEVAYTTMTFYHGNNSGQIPGLLGAPYYWWMCGGFMGSMLQYEHYTGDTTYNAQITQALQFQVGPHDDFMPPNQTASMGNDDQAFWAMSALQAAENNYPNPLPTQPGWLALAQAVFNEQAARWDTEFCNGGLRWQVPFSNTGYDLKNTITNGCFFNLAARLARYTGDQFYYDWAIKSWDWMVRIGLIDTISYNVYDSTEADNLNCTTIGHNQWTYNAGVVLMGASTLYNFTNGSDIWRSHTQGLLNTIEFDFFPNHTGVMKDICEDYEACNYDQVSFKAYLARWMAVSIQMAPFTYNQSHTLLLASAKAAIAQCTGGPQGTWCGQQWYKGVWDGTSGPGQQMSALEAILGTLVTIPSDDSDIKAPVTNTTGGTSPSDPGAGYNGSATYTNISPATESGRAGAWVLTAGVSAIALFTWVFMSTEMFEDGRSTVAGGKRKRSRKSMVGKLEKNSSVAVNLDSKGKGVDVASPMMMSPATTMTSHRRGESANMDPRGGYGAAATRKTVVPVYKGGKDLT